MLAENKNENKTANKIKYNKRTKNENDQYLNLYLNKEKQPSPVRYPRLRVGKYRV